MNKKQKNNISGGGFDSYCSPTLFMLTIINFIIEFSNFQLTPTKRSAIDEVTPESGWIIILLFKLF